MAATGTGSRPTATLLTTAAILAVFLALAAAPASASQLNFFSRENCQGNFLFACRDFSCCAVPDGAASYSFHYVPSFKAFLYGESDCPGQANAEINNDIRCANGVNFRSAYLDQNPPRTVLKMASEQ